MKKILFLLIIPIFFLKTNAYASASYIVLDCNTYRIIEGSNYNERHLTASISKILTAIIAIEKSSLDDILVADMEAINQEGSKVYLKENMKYDMKYLLHGLLLRSGNDCANLISRHIGGTVEGFAYIMNEYAKMLNMKNSTFENPSGLDSSTKNYSTCYDMALLMSYCQKNEIFKEINSAKKYEGMLNKHRLLQLNSIFECGKTGYTEKCGRTLITTASSNSNTFVCVSFEISNDFEFHKNKLTNDLEEYKSKKVLRKSYVNQNIKELDYLLYYEELVIPKSRKEKLSYKIAINKEELIVYSNSIEVLRVKLIREYIRV